MPDEKQQTKIATRHPKLPDIQKIRRNETTDIVKRLGFITPRQIKIRELGGLNPMTAFNPSIVVDKDKIFLYARIVVGYFTYTSAVVEISLGINEVLSGDIQTKSLDASLSVIPSNFYDLWGVEDPRTYVVDGKLYMTYTGRTKLFFTSVSEKTVPVTAVGQRCGERICWKKEEAHFLPKRFRENVVMNKDAFYGTVGGKVFYFHRPELLGGEYYVLAGTVGSSVIGHDGIREVEVVNNVALFEASEFEKKIGWSTPPIEVDSKYIVLLHGVDKKNEAYKVFAAELEVDGNSIDVSAVTPTYIIEPREPYELFGDRPFTVFPCGFWRIDDKIIISYGAGDFLVGLGLLNVDELLSLLDKGRLE